MLMVRIHDGNICHEGELVEILHTGTNYEGGRGRTGCSYRVRMKIAVGTDGFFKTTEFPCVPAGNIEVFYDPLCQ